MVCLHILLMFFCFHFVRRVGYSGQVHWNFKSELKIRATYLRWGTHHQPQSQVYCGKVFCENCTNRDKTRNV